MATHFRLTPPANTQGVVPLEVRLEPNGAVYDDGNHRRRGPYFLGLCRGTQPRRAGPTEHDARRRQQ
jgi:hypothetical protein